MVFQKVSGTTPAYLVSPLPDKIEISAIPNKKVLAQCGNAIVGCKLKETSCRNLYSIRKIYFNVSTTIFALQDNNIFRYSLNHNNNTTSFEKIESDNLVYIYPNPVNDYFQISHNIGSIYKLEVVGIAG